jgi:hypothetical protein
MICAVSAFGEQIPPMFIFVSPGKSTKDRAEIPIELHKYEDMNAYWCYQANGYNNNEVLLLWLKHVFSQRSTIKEPCLLIMDGVALHKMHNVCDYMYEHNIQPEFFSPNATCRLQPLDHCLNALLKKWMKEFYADWMRLDPTYTKF